MCNNQNALILFNICIVLLKIFFSSSVVQGSFLNFYVLPRLFWKLCHRIQLMRSILLRKDFAPEIWRLKSVLVKAEEFLKAKFDSTVLKSASNSPATIPHSTVHTHCALKNIYTLIERSHRGLKKDQMTDN